ncbi:MAG: sugar transporter [Prevotella sp.]|nr:sugar transporter [Prevotella sp.]
MSGRVHKSILNAEVNLLFYFLSLFLAFFSRKIFLSCLGDEFIGLTGTLGNILGYLNLAELGIGTSISYFLYKPLQSDDRAAICDIMSVFGYLYKCIGTAILLMAVVVSLFFPWIFKGEQVALPLVFFTFFSLLGSSLIGYFINYRQILLSADQKNYVVAICTQTANIVKTILQIVLAMHYSNPYVWVGVEFVFGILVCIMLNWKISREYPWLRCDKSQGRRLLKNYPDILSKTRQVFVHKLKFFVLGKSDELFIFAFVSLKMVAYYNNYMMIIGKLTTMFIMAIGSVGAGVGNLIAEGNHANTMKVFWELSAVRYFITGIICCSLYCFIEPFIALWLGPQYILPRHTLVLLLAYFYINISHGAVDTFIYGLGLYADTWSAWAELAINLSITLVAGYYIGIDGILLGKVVSTLLIAVFWKPYYLFTAGLHETYASYWRGTLPYHLVFVVSTAATLLFLHYALPDGGSTYLAWTLRSGAGVAVFLLVNVPLYLLLAPGSKDLYRRLDLRSKLSRFIHR